MLAKTLLTLSIILVIVNVVFFPTFTGTITPIMDILYGVQYGIIGYVYVCILTQPGEVLGGWREWLEWQHFVYFNKKAIELDKDATDYVSQKKWILKPILTCEKCVAGQIAFWLYPIASKATYSLSGHLAAICTAILIAQTLPFVWKKIKN